MKTPATTKTDADLLAMPLAPEDVRPGDFVTISYEILEVPSYFWSCDAQLLPPQDPVRLPWRTADCGMPLKVKAVCLPFVFVKLPSRQHRTLDVRQHRLVRLTSSYARAVWKALARQAAAQPSAGALL